MKRSTVSLAVLVFYLGAVGACGPPASDPKGGLIQAANGADLKGYSFASTDDDSEATASFTSPALKTPTILENDGTLVVGYKAVRDKKKNTTTNYRQDIIRSGRSLSFVITDLGTNQVVERQTLTIPPPPPPPPPPPLPTCPTCDKAFADFNCNRRPSLQCEANRTCRIQLTEVVCDNSPGQGCPHWLVLVAPTRRVCSIANFPLPDQFLAD